MLLTGDHGADYVLVDVDVQRADVFKDISCTFEGVKALCAPDS